MSNKLLASLVLLLVYQSCIAAVSGVDTVRVSSLIAKSINLQNSNPDSAMVYASEANRLAEALGDDLWIAKSLTSLGAVYLLSGEYVEAMNRYQRALDLYTKLKELRLIARAKFSIGIIYSRTANYDRAVPIYLNALQIAETIGDKEIQSKIYNSLGIISRQQGNYKEAIQNYGRALALHDETKNRVETAGTYTNIANIYLRLGRADTAVQINQRALFLFDSLDNQRGKIVCYNNLAEGYRLLKDYPSALRYLNMSLKASKSQKGFRSHYVNGLIELGQTLMVMEFFSEAERHFKLAIQNVESKELTTLARAYKGLATCYSKMGKPQQAYETLQNTLALNDSIFNHEKTAAIANAKASHELDKKESEIKLLVAENKTKQFYLIASVLIAILIVTVVLLSVSYVNLRLREKKELAEMSALRAQMNPHFIFNSLNSINLFIIRANPEAASSYLTKFARLIRMVLENSTSEYVSLEQELAVLELYVELELLRFDNKFACQFDVDPAIDAAHVAIPPLLFQPYIENAIWHGLMEKKGQGLLRIMLSSEDSNLVCTIDDNGVGRAAAKGKRGRKSFGMNITSGRILALKPGRKIKSLEIIDKVDENGAPCGTTVTIRLPLKTYTAPKLD